MYKRIDFNYSGHTGNNTANKTPIIIIISKKFLYLDPF
jgi:hypothetical protein